MHHQDFSGDPAGTGSKKMPHQAATFHHRRGSSGAPASSAAGGSNVDDNASQAGSSSPMLHHQTQAQATGAQVKKKSGFQITSVTSAQISANNSLADDTESYDDMDESHTEDLSSSEMLDVSAVSRATDTGVPERSSSDETLNSLHGVDTPGLVSPNEPLHPHAIPPGSQQQASMVNGTVHHHPQQHSHSHHHHHSDSMGGAQLPLSATGGAPTGAPVANSSPAPVSTAVPGPSQSQRPPVLDNIIPAGGAAIQPVVAAAGGAAAETHLSGNVNALNASAVNASGGGGQGVSAGMGPGSVAQGPAATPSAPPQQPQTQAATGSRFRVVKLDTNSEPFRKGRWMCTEYYEKEIPQTAASETARAAAEVPAETEPASPGAAALQPPQTLQPYPQPGQDFTSPQPMQTPAQGLPLQEVVGGGGGGHILQQPPSVPQVMPQGAGGQPPSMMPQPVPYAAESQQAQAQAGYAPPQLPGGMVGQGAVRQPDFIQPTAPFQTQVPPQPHITPSVSMTMGLGGGTQPAGAVAPQLLLQRQAPAAHANFAPGAQPQQQLHPSQAQAPSAATMPFQVAPTHGTPYLPLTSLQADLQPLLAPSATFMQTSGATYGGLPHVDMSSLKSAQLDERERQRLLFQHQSLLDMPRGERTVTQAIGAAGALTQMGMAAEASALVAAAAAGLRTQTVGVEGDDSSSGTSVVAIDNKIEQAMDLVKSHLMYAVREEVEVLKEQIKELIERNSQLEQENNLLKTLASPEQMAQFQAQVQTGGSPTAGANNAIAAVNPAQPLPVANAPSLVAPSSSAQNTGTSA